jgi:acyl dehydratase
MKRDTTKQDAKRLRQALVTDLQASADLVSLDWDQLTDKIEAKLGGSANEAQQVVSEHVVPVMSPSRYLATEMRDHATDMVSLDWDALADRIEASIADPVQDACSDDDEEGIGEEGAVWAPKTSELKPLPAQLAQEVPANDGSIFARPKRLAMWAMAAAALIFAGRQVSSNFVKNTTSVADRGATAANAASEFSIAGIDGTAWVQHARENGASAGEQRVRVGTPVRIGDRVRLEGNAVDLKSLQVGHEARLEQVDAQGHAAMTILPGAEVRAAIQLVQGAIATDSVESQDMVLFVGNTKVVSKGGSVRVARHGSRLRVQVRRGRILVGTSNAQGSALRTVEGAQMFDVDEATGASIPVELGEPSSVASSAAIAQSPDAVPNHAHPVPGAPKDAPKPKASNGNVVVPAVAPKDALSQGVAACIREKITKSDVKLTVQTTLSLTIVDGKVQFARFLPPLSSEAQECAAAKIYGTSGLENGSFTMPFTVTSE